VVKKSRLQDLEDAESSRHMKTIKKKLEDLITADDGPLPLSVIPNYMGINLVSVDSIEWVEQDDGQLVSLTIHFIPSPVEQ
jgi:hypothetical protein